MALSAKLSNEDYRVYTLLGDGEIQEGQVWEAAMLASHRKLDNLVVIVDNNGLQIDGAIDEVCSPYPIDKKFEAFNFHVINVDGHDFDALDAAFKEARETKVSRQRSLQRRSKERTCRLWRIRHHGMALHRMQNNMQLQWQI